MTDESERILRHFLVPLDGSVMAEAALPVAFGLAKPLGATITLLHVLERAAPRTIHGEPHLQATDSASAYLVEVAAQWSNQGVPIDWHVHPNKQDNVARSIGDHAIEMHADIVVITTHGSGGLRDLLFGSIAQQIVRRDTIPTLVVRPPQNGVLTPYHCESILVPIDQSHQAQPALQVAEEIVLDTGAELILMSVIPTLDTATGDWAVSATFSPTATAAVMDLAQSDAGQILEQTAERLRAEGARVRTLISRGRVTQQIDAAADANGVSLLVLATHGRSGLDGTMSGSVSQRLLPEIHCPILLVRISPGG